MCYSQRTSAIKVVLKFKKYFTATVKKLAIYLWLMKYCEIKTKKLDKRLRNICDQTDISLNRRIVFHLRGTTTTVVR